MTELEKRQIERGDKALNALTELAEDFGKCLKKTVLCKKECPPEAHEQLDKVLLRTFDILTSISNAVQKSFGHGTEKHR